MNIKNLLIVIAFLFFVVLGVKAQNSSKDYWSIMLENNNKEAYEVFLKSEKEYEKSIELLISNEILRNENGLINGASDGFLNKLMKFKDFEYYVYALWNDPFMFEDYLKTGFHEKNVKSIKTIEASKVENKTIFYALKYLKGVVERDHKDIVKYDEAVKQVDAIKDWQYCGVFENLNKSGYDTSYEPELYAKNDKLFDANSNGTINWYTPNKEYQKEPYQFFSNHIEYGYGVNYAQTFITTDKEQRVQLRMGNSSAFKVWLNDVLVYENDKDVDTDLDAYTVNVNLSKGTNRLLIKNAENNGMSYFMARLSDFEGNKLDGITYSSKYASYNKATISAVNPEKKSNTIEDFFVEKLKENPTNFFYKYCLIKTYFRNQKYEEANVIINDLLKTHTKSSLLRVLKTYTSSFEGDFNAINELNKNIFLEDPNYYYSLVKKASDFQELERMSIAELEVYIDKLRNATDSPILKFIAQFVLDIRNEDIKALKATMNDLNNVASDRVFVLQRFIPLYDNIFQDQERSITEYEKILKKRFSPALLGGLARLYDKTDRKDDVLQLYKEYVKDFPAENEFLFSLIERLHQYEKYQESLPFIKQALENYPYSFKAMEFMGNALTQLNQKDKAVDFYQQSLIYNNGNNQLLKKIETIKRAPNFLEKFTENDVYSYVEKERNKYLKNNYGTNILLDSKVYQIYETGALKAKSVYLYEITSKNGIENYKEYDLGLSGSYSILKSEIIKKDKSVIPAERTGSSFVFNGLEVGDVIYVDYETTSVSSGRFFKDFVDDYQFDSESFCLKTSYTLITPKNLEFTHKVTNGKLDYTKKSEANYDVHQWQLLNAAELPKGEDYMPTASDYARFLHISTIKSWNEIANWYSDLVRSQSVFNAEVEQKYNEIFPEKDVLSLSEEERAKRIYYYIMNNFTYSFVDFKQSGFIPQKPSKTISSKLGDCKDFSTLFATFARRAGLDVNLVLVLTSDYGMKSLILPSQNFNHCIVKIKLNGKDQFLELTDKNMPFKSIPNSLLNATALEIPYMVDESKESTLFHLSNMDGNPSNLISEVFIKVDENKTQNITINSKVTGSLASIYFNILNQDNFELVKEDILADFNQRIGEGLVLDTIKDIAAQKGTDFLTYTTKVHLDDKMNEMGSMTFFKLPLVAHSYNGGIVSLEERKYAIDYQSYENSNFYNSVYNLEIPAGKKFIEIPENQKFNYKQHSFEVLYKAVSENQLQITIAAATDLSDIAANEYLDFKSYVEKVLKAKDILIGYK
ncbi:protein of unknown function [Polaribacter sp. KT25b]|uniref:transglutaminase domain-containing protein n=1 Tax=Polaribacter sp. KT25b TaxID=1855336 RepID=UPI00087AED8A|nr:transglutaminase domain-containing protein [Polaribacter sp. KT25b]SDS20731.1 protein of unknown function [Polaribacter sp. KT25b]